MHLARTALCLTLLSVALAGQGPDQVVANLPATGKIAGLVTAANAESMTISGLIFDKPASRTFRINPNVKLSIIPTPEVAAKGGGQTTMVYKDAQSGGLKGVDWFAKNPQLVGKTLEVDARDGVIVAANLFPSCTRERCSSSMCKRMCKATSCVCPI